MDTDKTDIDRGATEQADNDGDNSRLSVAKENAAEILNQADGEGVAAAGNALNTAQQHLQKAREEEQKAVNRRKAVETSARILQCVVRERSQIDEAASDLTNGDEEE